MQNKKTLFIDDEEIASAIRLLKPTDIEKKDAEVFPNICCLCYAVSQLDQYFVQEGSADKDLQAHINKVSIEGI